MAPHRPPWLPIARITAWTIPPPPPHGSVEKLSSTKASLVPKRLGTAVLKTNHGPGKKGRATPRDFLKEYIKAFWKMIEWYFTQTFQKLLGVKSISGRNELWSHERTWKKLKCILLSERSQPEKATHWMSSTIWYSGKGNSIETVKKWTVVARVREEREGGMNRKSTGDFSEWWKYYILCYNGGSWRDAIVKTHRMYNTKDEL